jgi:hypothetical protein
MDFFQFLTPLTAASITHSIVCRLVFGLFFDTLEFMQPQSQKSSGLRRATKLLALPSIFLADIPSSTP